MGTFNPEAAEAKAEHWLKQNGITSLPVDPFEIASSLGITVQPKSDVDTGVSGMLLRYGDSFGIIYATHIKSIGYQRFSIAHELGHYLLEGHPELLFPDGDATHYSKAGFVSSELHEREADHFASGLLMPDGPFRAVLRRGAEGLEGIEDLAAKCMTSITATAIRYAKKTRVPAAIVVSTAGRVDYSFMSADMKEFPGIISPKKGDILPAKSLTEKFSSEPGNVAQSNRDAHDTDLSLWLGGRRGIRAREEVLGLGSYRKLLTVITTDHLPDEEDEDAELEKAWTPQFKR